MMVIVFGCCLILFAAIFAAITNHLLNKYILYIEQEKLTTFKQWVAYYIEEEKKDWNKENE